MANKAKILLVDDEEDILELTKIELEQAGYKVLTAYNGRSFLEMARKEKPDIVILDVMLPDMDGFEALRQLKRDAQINKIPVLLHTSHKDLDPLLQATKKQPVNQAFIYKGSKTSDLLTKIEQILKK